MVKWLGAGMGQHMEQSFEEDDATAVRRIHRHPIEVGWRPRFGFPILDQE